MKNIFAENPFSGSSNLSNNGADPLLTSAWLWCNSSNKAASELHFHNGSEIRPIAIIATDKMYT